eukprot:TRINITY_DN11191_c0_g3_i2.p1 TRINITY_DN11191_c0_g3~~TRINITY_DN11191_c0_g3_i2.p1  ORF type:complete len:248 (+),score=35.93 TRINITY_DN11191_c0_g3_i2:155-898(+)
MHLHVFQNRRQGGQQPAQNQPAFLVAQPIGAPIDQLEVPFIATAPQQVHFQPLEVNVNEGSQEKELQIQKLKNLFTRKAVCAAMFAMFSLLGVFLLGLISGNMGLSCSYWNDYEIHMIACAIITFACAFSCLGSLAFILGSCRRSIPLLLLTFMSKLITFVLWVVGVCVFHYAEEYIKQTRPNRTWIYKMGTTEVQKLTIVTINLVGGLLYTTFFMIRSIRLIFICFRFKRLACGLGRGFKKRRCHS